MAKADYEGFIEALHRAATAKASISGNRGYDRELAKEGYESAVADLAPEYRTAVEWATSGDLESADVHKLAMALYELLRRRGVVQS